MWFYHLIWIYSYGLIMFYFQMVNLIDTHGHLSYWCFRHGMVVVVIYAFRKNFKEKHVVSLVVITTQRWMMHRKATCMSHEKNWLCSKSRHIDWLFVFVCLCFSNVWFLTPYHCFCIHPAIMTDCKAKEKRKSTTSNLPCLLDSCLISFPASHCINMKHTCHFMEIWKMKVQEDAGCQFFVGFMPSFR